MLTAARPRSERGRRIRADRLAEPVRFPCSAPARLARRARARPRPRVVRLLRRLQLHRPAARAPARDRHGPGGLPGGGARRLRDLPGRGPRRGAAHVRPAAGGARRLRQRRGPDRLLPGGRARPALAGRADRRHGRDRAGRLGAGHGRQPRRDRGGGDRAGDGRRGARGARRAAARRPGAALPGPARERDLGRGLGGRLRRVPHRAAQGHGGRARLGAVRRARSRCSPCS